MYYTEKQTKQINTLYSKVEDGLITVDEADEAIHELVNPNRERLYIQEKTSYGRTLFYPACERAKEYAQELGRKTFSKSNLHFIESLGIKVSCKSNDYWQSRY